MTLTRAGFAILEGLGTAATKNLGTAPGDVPEIGTMSALTTQAGLIQLATSAEAISGIDSDKAITPLTLQAAFVKSLAATGYIKFPGGMALQWGVTASIASGTSLVVTFPLAFAVLCRQVLAGVRDNSAVTTAATGQWGTGVFTATTFTLYNRTSQAYVFNWIALGD